MIRKKIYFFFVAAFMSWIVTTAFASMAPTPQSEIDMDYPQKAPIVNVLIREGSCHPMTMTLRIGTAVKWINKDNEIHTITGIGTDFKIAPGEALAYTFNTIGTYRYRCSTNAGMGGVIEVIPGD